ncbi:MAG TPA: hypothetical protein VFZ53_09355 [Polyangiaceae bacterium]
MNKQAWFDKATTRLERVSELTGLSPGVLTAFVILIAGFLLALLSQGAARRLSSRAARLIAGLNHTGRDMPDTTAIDQGVGRAVFWLVMVCAGMAATETLGLPVVTAWLSGVATFVPRVVVAIFIVALGIVAARVTRQVVSRMAASARLTGADRVGRIAELVLLVSTALIAIEQLGVEVSFLKTTLLIVLGALVGGAALAFGLGGRELVANILAAHYVHKIYQVGQTVRIGDAEGRIVRFTETSVILESPEGQIAVPARRFSDRRSILVTSVPGAR